jgi:hypothetical protein
MSAIPDFFALQQKSPCGVCGAVLDFGHAVIGSADYCMPFLGVSSL